MYIFDTRSCEKYKAQHFWEVVTGNKVGIKNKKPFMKKFNEF